MAMTIGDLARRGGVGVETVRFYQRRGLIETPLTPSGVRRYDAGHLDRLRFVRTAQRAGFTLAQVGELLALDADRDRPRIRALATERVAALDQTIADLTRARDSLARLARDCAKAGQGPCPIIDAFDHGVLTAD